MKITVYTLPNDYIFVIGRRCKMLSKDINLSTTLRAMINLTDEQIKEEFSDDYNYHVLKLMAPSTVYLSHEGAVYSEEEYYKHIQELK